MLRLGVRQGSMLWPSHSTPPFSYITYWGMLSCNKMFENPCLGANKETKNASVGLRCILGRDQVEVARGGGGEGGCVGCWARMCNLLAKNVGGKIHLEVRGQDGRWET